MRSLKTEGIIIKRKNYGESDRLVSVFTREHGKLIFLAKGVRKITSHRSAHIELLNYTKIAAYRSSFYPIVTEASVIEDFSVIKDDLIKIGFAYHICEIVDGLCAEGQENEEIFTLLKQVLFEFSFTEDIASLIRGFEIKLLTMLGFWRDNQTLASELDTKNFVENILERRLKSKRIFSYL